MTTETIQSTQTTHHQPRTEPIATHGPGELFGDVSLLSAKPSLVLGPDIEGWAYRDGAALPRCAGTSTRHPDSTSVVGSGKPQFITRKCAESSLRIRVLNWPAPVSERLYPSRRTR